MSITSYIYEDLKTRIQSNEELPMQLTLESLSDFYEVSFSPVRSAVNRLIKQGILLKGEDRRLTAKKTSNRSSKRAKPKSLPVPPQDMYDVIANEFVRLSLEGKAIDLREEATAQQYGISRSGLRIIFNRLAGAGLIEHIPRKGWRLRPFRQKDLQSFLEVRELLELKALDLAKEKLDKQRLEEMFAGNQLPKTKTSPPKIDNRLHAYIIEESENIYIQDFFQRHGRYYEILFDWEEMDRAAAIETVHQHHAILQALLDEDWQSAKDALAFHIQNNHPVLSRINPK
ncbi:GntR family transcriptional regulator [Bremerella sp. JC770]|uniref:GntR family transcriptional regulator n=1 Tax=Bremerella sp. JC770 TaxID=3232137 RepID=UPI00345A4007